MLSMAAFPGQAQIGQDPEALNEITALDGSPVAILTPAVKEALLKNIQRRMTPQPLKIRADVEMTCFNYDGVLHIQAAMRAAEATGTEECPVKMKLVAPPLYVMTTQTLEKELGIEVQGLHIKTTSILTLMNTTSSDSPFACAFMLL